MMCVPTKQTVLRAGNRSQRFDLIGTDKHKKPVKPIYNRNYSSKSKAQKTANCKRKQQPQ